MDKTPTLVARGMTPSESCEVVLPRYVSLCSFTSNFKLFLTPSPSSTLHMQPTRPHAHPLWTISGGIVGVTWLYELHWCPRRAKSEGTRLRKFLDPLMVKGPFILLPDLAVIKGQAQLEQKIVLDKRHEYKYKHENGRVEAKNGEKSESKELKHVKTATPTHKEERALAEEL